ncbi:MAG: hypothetical protein ABFS42_15565 [Candidatus Krumholzibacteriota bacterium]
MRHFILVLLVIASLPAMPVDAADHDTSSFTVAPIFDLRVRQEILDGVYHFAPDPDRNWVRFRTRLGAEAAGGNHDFRILLTNEHRRYVRPDNQDFDWDEIILDQASWTWAIHPETKLTLGRQNIIWDRGFLMLEGHPLDGSRSMYQNAVRLQAPLGGSELDMAVIHNPKRDPIVLAGDNDLPLADADETAVAVRLTGGSAKVSLIWKNEVDPDQMLPDLQVLTLGGRTDRRTGDNGELMGELAVQYQREGTGSAGNDDGFAMALQTHFADDLGAAWHGKAGFFFYSGAGNGMRAFRTPWGRWPKWSELYIYTLIGESSPGRVNVAAWENIAAPHGTVSRPLGKAARFRFSAYYLLAPQTDWAARGVMTQTELKFDLMPGLDGHLLWEMLAPGAYHDGAGGREPLTSTVHFLRWQLTYAFK